MSKQTAPVRRNLQLQSISSNNTQSIPIDETLEDAIIDLYLSVKIRSNDEVSLLKYNTIHRSTNMMRKRWVLSGRS
jgi:hypothetical protein